MYRNYFVVALRNFRKSKVFSMINVVGLTLAIASCTLLLQYVKYELSYDQHWENKDRIFRLQEDRLKEGEIINQWATTVGKVGPTIKHDLPEVQEYVQIFPYRLTGPDPVIRTEEKFFKETEVHFASERFFKVFSTRLISGVDSLVLLKRNAIVISRSMEEKYFNGESAVGRILNFDKFQDFEITGVFEDFPENSHFKPDFLVSLNMLLFWLDNNLTWNNGGFHTYVLLREGTDLEKFQSKLPAYILKNAEAELKPWNEELILNMQAITDIHLDSHFVWEFEENGDRSTVYFMGIIGVIIFMLALINYINLSIAKSIERTKEIGIRKVMGSFRKQLVDQFMIESLLTASLSILAAILILFGISSEVFNWLQIEIPENEIISIPFWLMVGGIALAPVVISSAYPALVLSKSPAAISLQGKLSEKNSKSGFFRTLVVVQVSASIVLIIIGFVVFAQIDFIRKMENGFHHERIMVIRAPNEIDTLYVGSLKGFKEDLRQTSLINGIAASSDIPGKPASTRAGGVRKLADSQEDAFDCTPPFVDYGYIEMMGMEILAGRAFSEILGDDYSKVVINEEAMRSLDISEPSAAVGEQITFWRDTFEIIGVVKNFHQESVHNQILPVVFRFGPHFVGYISVQAGNPDLKSLVTETEKVWKKYFADFPFEFFFLSDSVQQQYKNDRQFEKAVRLFSGIALFIACIGLFGLSMLNTSKRMKEIAVRKILGASIKDLLVTLNAPFFRLTLLSLCIALPVSWLAVEQWLDSFVKRIDLSIWFFVAPSLIALLFAALSISIYTAKAASETPVKTIRQN